jgi:hypothetical protein
MRLLRASWFLAFAALLLTPPLARADDAPPPYGASEAPVYLIVSFDDQFNSWGLEYGGSHTIMVNVGSLVGGDGQFDATFAVNQALTEFPLPPEELGVSFQDLQDNDATVLGSFMTSDLTETHMVTPSTEPVDPDIQSAVFEASNSGMLDAMIAEVGFPTTEQVSEWIAFYLPEGSDATAQDVFGLLAVSSW